MQGTGLVASTRHTLIAVALLAAQSAALAATQPGNDLANLSVEELADIDVSAASLLNAHLLDAASSIGTVSAEDWQRRGARRLLDALETQPATLVLPHTSGNQVLAIRGYARNTSYTGVATSWDGVPLNDLFRSAPQFNTPTLNLGTLSQIQLIQGPGSALYGSDAFHGLIALRSFDSEQDVSQTRAAGSDGYYEASLQHSQSAFASSRLHLAVAANGQPDQERRVQFTNPLTQQEQTVKRANRYAAETVSLKLNAEASQPRTWHVGLYLHNYDADAFQGLGTRLSGGNDLGWLDTRFAMTQAGVRQQLNDQRSLELKAYYWWVDNDLASILRLPSGPVHRDLLTTQFRDGVQAIYRDAYQPWQTEAALAVGQEWLGVRSAKAEVRSLQGQLLNTVTNPADGARRHIRSATLEMHTHWQDQRWRLVYGGRLDDYSDFGQHTSPRLGLIYYPRPDSAIKLLYGEAFRAPAAVEIGGAQGSVLGNPDLKPEVIESYELIALRQTPRYLAQLTLFRTYWHEGIAAVLTQGTLSQYQNVERNDAHGITTAVQARLHGWLLELSGSSVQSRNTRTGLRYNIFPRHMLSAGVGHSLHDPSWQLHLHQRWLSTIDDIPTAAGFTPTKLPRYARTDLAVKKDMSHQLSISVQARNLFDRDNRLPSPPGAIGGIPDERFSINCALSYSF